MSARLEALEKVAAAAKAFRTEQYSEGRKWERMEQLFNALDALPPKPVGEAVEVRAVVFADPSFEAWTVYGNHCDEDQQVEDECQRLAWDGERRVATITARIPLPPVPTIAATVFPITTGGEG